MAIALTFKNEAARSRRIGGDHGVDVFFQLVCFCVVCVCVESRRERREKRKKY